VATVTNRQSPRHHRRRITGSDTKSLGCLHTIGLDQRAAFAVVPVAPAGGVNENWNVGLPGSAYKRSEQPLGADALAEVLNQKDIAEWARRNVGSRIVPDLRRGFAVE